MAELPQYAPIALFVYNRFDHAQQTIDALRKNEGAIQSDLIVFSDGPKNTEAREGVEKVRALVQSLSGFKSVKLVARDTNQGLAQSIITGVSEILSHSEAVIVVEDDLVSSPYFLKFMNEGLQKYRVQSQVMSVLGYSFPTKKSLPETYFLKGADCWGWATWKRAWKHFESDGSKLLSEIRSRDLESEFDLNGSVPYVKMLEDQIAKRNNSWAIRWRASVFLQNGLAIYPGRSLIENIGLDGTGTHCSETDMFSTRLAQTPIVLKDIPLEQSEFAFKQIVAFYRSQKNFFKRARSYFKRKIWSRLKG